MGWLCVVAAVPLYHSLGMTGVILMVAGGLSYTIGAFFYRSEEHTSELQSLPGISYAVFCLKKKKNKKKKKKIK